MFRLVWLQSACVSICVSGEAGGGRAVFPGHRLASRITSVCFPAGLGSGRELHHGVQHSGQLPGPPCSLFIFFTESHRCNRAHATYSDVFMCVFFFSRRGLIGVKACLKGPVSAIGGNMGGCSRMSKLTTVDFSLIRFKFNSSHSYAVSFDLVYQLFIVSSVPD